MSFLEWVRGLSFGDDERGRSEWARLPLTVARALEPIAARLGVQGLGKALDRLELAHGARGAIAQPVLDELDRALERLQPQRWGFLPPMPPEAAIVRIAQMGTPLSWYRGHGPDALAELANQALYPRHPWAVEPGVDAAIEASFPGGDGRLWGLRQVVSEELIAFALGPSIGSQSGSASATRTPSGPRR